MKTKNLFHILLLLVCVVVFNGCAGLLISGKREPTVIRSEPAGADVYDANRVKVGTTPYTVDKMSETQMVYSVEKDGYEKGEIEVKKIYNKGIVFLDAMLLCIPCIADMNSDKLYSFEKIDGTIKLRKKLKEYDKTVLAELDKVEVALSQSAGIGTINGSKITMDSKGVSRQIGYTDNYDESVFQILKNSWIEPRFASSSSSKKESEMRKPKVIIKVAVKDIHFDLKGKTLSEYKGPCSMKTEWKIYKVKDKEKPLAVIPIVTNAYRAKGNPDYIIPSMLTESARDFLDNDTLYDFLNKLTDEVVAASKGESIKLKKPSVKATAGTKDKFKNALQAVVTIEEDDGFGSGVIISNDGYIVTNYHVVEDQKHVNIRLNQEIKLSGDVVKTNPDYDLALVKVSAADLKALRFGNSDDADVGDEVYAIGTPADTKLSQTLTKGIISGRREFKNINFIQTDVSISPGNSGGPLINDKGEIIGITTMKLKGEGYEGLGFCIPSNTVLEMLNIKFE